MKRSIKRRAIGATRALLAPVNLLWMAACVWIGMILEELFGEG